tara:strand:+ start:1048 stop:1875 length:828 start_codon:yes stop_codon:yes gene_type:complete
MRIGLVITNDVIKKYEITELRNLIKSNFEITYIFSEKKELNKKFKIFKILNSIVKNRFFYLIYLEQKLSSYFKKDISYFEKLKDLEKNINIFDEFPKIKKIPKKNFECVKCNNRFTFSKEMINIIKKNCDILILLGFNKILHKEVLDITDYGILSFHTSNTNKYRGRPAAFNEFINNEKFGGVTLQLLSKEIDSGLIVNQRDTEIENSKSFDETLYRMMCLKSDVLLEGLKKIKNNEKFLKPKNESKYSTFANSRKLNKVFICLKKTINKRYLNR